MIERLKAAWAALAGKEDDPRNGGHRYGVQSSSDIYSWADAVRLDPMTGEPEWYCDRGDYCELKKKLPGWGILVDLQPEETLSEFKTKRGASFSLGSGKEGIQKKFDEMIS